MHKSAKPKPLTTNGLPHRYYSDRELATQMSPFIKEHWEDKKWKPKILAWLFLFGTGLRIGELFPEKITTEEDKKNTVMLSDCHPSEWADGRRFSGPWIWIRSPEKKSWERGVRVAPWAASAFERRIIESKEKRRRWPISIQNVWRGEDRPITRKSAYTWIMEVIEAAGMRRLHDPRNERDMTVHWGTRTTFATWTAQLYREGHPWGIPLVDLQHQLGHTPGKNTAEEFYLRAVEERVFNRHRAPAWTEAIMEAQGLHPLNTEKIYGG